MKDLKVCPNCGNEDLIYEEIHQGQGIYFDYQWTCLKCNTNGTVCEKNQQSLEIADFAKIL